MNDLTSPVLWSLQRFSV